MNTNTGRKERIPAIIGFLFAIGFIISYALPILSYSAATPVTTPIVGSHGSSGSPNITIVVYSDGSARIILDYNESCSRLLNVESNNLTMDYRASLESSKEGYRLVLSYSLEMTSRMSPYEEDNYVFEGNIVKESDGMYKASLNYTYYNDSSVVSVPDYYIRFQGLVFLKPELLGGNGTLKMWSHDGSTVDPAWIKGVLKEINGININYYRYYNHTVNGANETVIIFNITTTSKDLVNSLGDLLGKQPLSTRELNNLLNNISINNIKLYDSEKPTIIATGKHPTILYAIKTIINIDINVKSLKYLRLIYSKLTPDITSPFPDINLGAFIPPENSNLTIVPSNMKITCSQNNTLHIESFRLKASNDPATTLKAIRQYVLSSISASIVSNSANNKINIYNLKVNLVGGPGVKIDNKKSEQVSLSELGNQSIKVSETSKIFDTLTSPVGIVIIALVIAVGLVLIALKLR